MTSAGSSLASGSSSQSPARSAGLWTDAAGAAMKAKEKAPASTDARAPANAFGEDPRGVAEIVIGVSLSRVRRMMHRGPQGPRHGGFGGRLPVSESPHRMAYSET